MTLSPVACGDWATPGYLWTFDPRTGDNPCRVGKQAVELTTPTSFYCDGKPGHVQGWDQVRFVSSRLDAFTEIRVTVMDSSHASLKQLGWFDRGQPPKSNPRRRSNGAPPQPAESVWW